LGVTFYELLTGNLPFDADSAMELVHCHIAKTPNPVCEVNSNIPPIISDIVMKLMAKNVEDRYQSAFGVKADLEKCQENLPGLKNLAGLSFQLAQNDFSGKLQIPQKLYGRENEIKALLQAFEHISEGPAEMMLIAGYSGVGKTALVHEVHKPMTEKHGYFAAGKFDQFQRNIPYSAISQAFNQFCNYLLTESAEQLKQWQPKILTAIGTKGQVLIDVIEQLELVIGPQPAVETIPPQEAQNRFNSVFQNFFQALCQQEHPLVLFIDDLQWADPASLQLLKLLMTDTKNHHFLIIGAYRDNEVYATHPLMITLSELQETGTLVNTISLPNLSHNDVNTLIADSLKSEPSYVQPLTDLVYEKTQGNAFFTNEFLKSLYEQALLEFEVKAQKWQWEIDKIAALNITDNVVELLAHKISQLPSQTVLVLKLAACIGNQFDLKTLSIISQSSQTDVLAHLWSAIKEGVILPQDDHYKWIDHPKPGELAYFKFLHDRVQQAAYALIDEAQKKTVHLSIGQLLLNQTAVEAKAEQLFKILDHLNIARSLLLKSEQKIELAQLNLTAGIKAKQATAYAASLQYLSIGMNCLSDQTWEENYDLVLALHKENAELEFLNGHFEQSERLIQETVAHVKTSLEKAEVLHILIVQYTLSARYQDAIQTGRQALALLGIELPDEHFEPERDKEMLEIKKRIGDKPIASLFDLPNMTDPIYITAVKLLITMGPPCYRSHQRLWGVIVAKVVHLTLQYGNVPQIGYSHTAYGGLLGYVWQDYTTGKQLGELATRLMNEKFTESSAAQSVFYLMIGSSVRHWYEPLQHATQDYQKAYQIGLDSGNLQYAVYAFGHNMYCRFYQGVNLAELYKEIDDYLSFCRSRKNQWGIDLIEGGQMVILNLMGQFKTTNPTEFRHTELTEAQFLERCEAHKNIQVLCIFYILKAWVLYLQGYFEKALESAKEAGQRLIAVATQGLLPSAEYRFTESLILLALYPHVSTEQQSRYWEKINENQKLAKIWAQNCPANFQPQSLLIAAEMARISEPNHLDIINLYDQAIASARKSGLIQYEALGNERATQFWLAQGKEKIAQLYLKEAHYAYQQWGALAKVADLEEHYPQWLAQKSASALSSTFTHTSKATIMASSTRRITTSSVLDLESVMKASQTLSGEIVLSRLLEKMMRIVIENAGAQRGFLILPHEEQWVIEAEGAIDQEEITTLHSLPVSRHLPDAIISYVARTQENVVLTDARREGLYTDNPYIKAHQTQSVLCFSIVYQQQLRAILYLENNLTTGVFTPQRLRVLQMLSSQIAISLENAQVMAHLDTKVKERTTQLNAKVEELTQTRQELVQSEKMASLGRLVAGFAHELNTPLGVAIGSASMLQEETKKINGLMEQEEVDVDELLSALDSIDKGSNLTLSNLERAANLVTSFKRTAVDQTSDEPRTFQVQQLLQDIITTLHSRFKKTAIDILIDCPKNLNVKSLPGSLEQILTNLLMNSLIHGFDEGQNAGSIKIKAQLDGDHLHLEYSDTGKGIAPENLEKIFEPFFTTHRAHGGSGLGMYICYNLVTTQLQGTITCESVLGEGVVFKIDYPREKTQNSSFRF
jgi:predicted ATPase/signal transduction histidine kinase